MTTLALEKPEAWADSGDGGATLADLLRRLRTARGLTRARAATAAGVSPSTLLRWEGGKTLPRLYELDALLDALDAPADVRRRALERLHAPRALARVRDLLTADASAAPPHGGDLLRALRGRAGRSAEQTAALVGVQRTTLSRWEKGETWPGDDQLHRLCFVLRARPDEAAALTLARVSLARAPAEGSPGGPASPLSPDRIAARLEWVGTYPHPPEKCALADLTYLSLAAHTAENLAARGRDGADPLPDTELLGRVCVSYGDWLYHGRRFEEAARYTAHGADLLRRCVRAGRLSGRDLTLMRARLRSAQLAALGRGRRGSEAALEILCDGRGLAATNDGLRGLDPIYATWIRSTLARHALHGGAADDARRLARQTLAEIDGVPGDTDRAFRRYEIGSLFAQMGETREAVALLPAHPHPYVATGAAALLADLGRTDEAAGRLAAARTWVDTHKHAHAHAIPFYAGKMDEIGDRVALGGAAA